MTATLQALRIAVMVRWLRIPARLRWYGARLPFVPVFLGIAAVNVADGDYLAAATCALMAALLVVLVAQQANEYRRGYWSAAVDIGQRRPPRGEPWDSTVDSVVVEFHRRGCDGEHPGRHCPPPGP